MTGIVQCFGCCVTYQVTLQEAWSGPPCVRTANTRTNKAKHNTLGTILQVSDAIHLWNGGFVLFLCGHSVNDLKMTTVNWIKTKPRGFDTWQSRDEELLHLLLFLPTRDVINFFCRFVFSVLVILLQISDNNNYYDNLILYSRQSAHNISSLANYLLLIQREGVHQLEFSLLP